MSKKPAKSAPLPQVKKFSLINFKKQRIEIQMMSLKEYIKLARERLASDTFKKENQLKTLVTQPTRNKSTEQTFFDEIAKNIETIDLFFLLETYTDTIKQNALNISNSQGNVQNVSPAVLPFITSLIYGLDSVGQIRQGPEIKKMFFDYFQKDITSPPFDVGIDPQIKPLVVPLCSKEKVQKYMKDFSIKYQLEQSVFGQQQQNHPQSQNMNYPQSGQQYPQHGQQYPQQGQQYPQQQGQQYPQNGQQYPQQGQQYPQQGQQQGHPQQNYLNQQGQRQQYPNNPQQGYQQQYNNAPPNWAQQSQGKVNFQQPALNKSSVPWQQKDFQQPSVPLQPPQGFVPLGQPIQTNPNPSQGFPSMKANDPNDTFGLAPNNSQAFVPLGSQQSSVSFANSQSINQSKQLPQDGINQSKQSEATSNVKKLITEPVQININHDIRSLNILRSAIKLEQQNQGSQQSESQFGEMRNIALMI